LQFGNLFLFSSFISSKIGSITSPTITGQVPLSYIWFSEEKTENPSKQGKSLKTKTGTSPANQARSQLFRR